MKGWEVRIIFILALGLAGTLASGSLMMGFIGLAIGIAAAVLEQLLVKISADRIIYITAGATAGLIAGILIILVLNIGIKSENRQAWSDLLVLIPVALAYVFAIVALRKGSRLELITLEEKDKVRWNMPVLVDLSAAVDGRIADLTLAGLLPGPFIIPSSVKSSIAQMQKGRNIVKRGRARRATETIERLEEAVGKAGGLVEYRDFGDGEREKNRILEWLRRESVTLLSADTEMCDVASREGIQVINLDDVGPASRKVVLPGDVVTVKVQKKGRTASQGVGFLSDGTMVVVDEAGAMIDKEVQVCAHTTFRASGGTMVFSRLAQDENNGNDTD
ncbi:hypothetical protein CSA37_03620 [Candidatus Fermentibacteria bacterium]|nr:MAG: hypothetical protein CSA37_03620 [Candidatus Fermentibacteria bacterium]